MAASFDPTTLAAWIIGFSVVAVLGAALAIGAVAEFVLSNRSVRVARHQSVRSYYGGLAHTH